MDPKTIQFAKLIIDESSASKTSIKKNTTQIVEVLKDYCKYLTSVAEDIAKDKKLASETTQEVSKKLKSYVSRLEGEHMKKFNDYFQESIRLEEELVNYAKIILKSSDKYDEPTKKWINETKIKYRQENDPFYPRAVEFNDYFMRLEKLTRNTISGYRKVDEKKIKIAEVTREYFNLALVRVEHGFNMVDSIKL